MQRKKKPDQLGTISDEITYPLAVFKKTAGLGDQSLRHLRQKGLKVIRTGGRSFVRGKDFSAFLSTLDDRDDAA